MKAAPSFRRFLRHERAASAVEFALLLPLYLFMLFGIFEICLVLLISMMLGWGSDRGVGYLEQQRQTYQAITANGLRSAVCSALAQLPVACDTRTLQIALINQDDPAGAEDKVSFPIANRFDDPNGGIYLLAIGYKWNLWFPSSYLMLPFSGPEAQLQSMAIAVLAERVHGDHQPMISRLRKVGGLISRDEGVAAVEFTLLLPLLILFYLVLFETGRGWLAQRKFHSTVENAARFAARFPEFDSEVRSGLPLVVQRTLGPLSPASLNLELVSATAGSAAPQVVFQYGFFGNTTGLDWLSGVRDSLFTPGEAIIVVTATYQYQPLVFTSFIKPITFQDTVVETPFFSRSYGYQAGLARWDYFNAQ